jgi:hypothetical protein
MRSILENRVKEMENSCVDKILYEELLKTAKNSKEEETRLKDLLEK